MAGIANPASNHDATIPAELRAIPEGALVVGYPKSKRPLPHPTTGGWWSLETHLDVATARDLAPSHNWVIDCLAAGLVQVDPDATEALAWLRRHGATGNGAWLIKSARGVKALYRAPDFELPLAWTDKSHQTADIGGRLCLAPPSLHPSGLLLIWLQGHSPFDIPISELVPLPSGILEAWRALKAPSSKSTRRNSPPPGWLGLVYHAILEHIEARGGRLRPTGNGGMVGHCPLHADRHPSFSVHETRGWKCFSGCGEGRLTSLAARLGISIL